MRSIQKLMRQAWPCYCGLARHQWQEHNGHHLFLKGQINGHVT